MVFPIFIIFQLFIMHIKSNNVSCFETHFLFEIINHNSIYGIVSILHMQFFMLLSVSGIFRVYNNSYNTDIITFDYCEGDMLSGDLFISLDTVRTNAEQFGKTYDDELHRVIIHGILHLVGINDKGPGEREIMEAAEDKALTLLSTMRNEAQKG